MHVEIADWRAVDVDWSDTPLTVVRSPWDYVDAYDEFVAWIRATGAVTDLWNPPALLEWNVHKSYLLDLAERGAPIVPTVVLLHETAADLDAICDARGWNQVVVKPAIGVGGLGSGRFAVGDGAGQAHLDSLLREGDVLVQPFLPAVEHEGELSVVLIDGAVSHGLRKQPATGEYRVHEERGGTTTLAPVDEAPAELATRVNAALPADLVRAHRSPARPWPLARARSRGDRAVAVA